jgi:hypothetical protein
MAGDDDISEKSVKNLELELLYAILFLERICST